MPKKLITERPLYTAEEIDGAYAAVVAARTNECRYGPSVNLVGVTEEIDYVVHLGDFIDNSSPARRSRRRNPRSRRMRT